MKAKARKKAPAKKKAGKDAPGAHLVHEEDGVDMQSILTEVHGAVSEKKHLEHWEPVECPYCGEGFEVHIDSAEDGQTMYEDCRVCCKPISLHVQVEEEDVHVSVARA